MELKSVAINMVSNQVQKWVQYRKLCIASEQHDCKHEELGECSYRHSEYGSGSPPVRICLHCGIAEQGWGCGYLVLKSNTVMNISREDLFGMHCGLMITEEHKGPLLRNETTLSKLIEGKADDEMNTINLL